MYRHIVSKSRAEIAYFLANFRVFMQGIGRRRQTDGRFTQKERAKTFCTILGDKFVLYTPGILHHPNARETLPQSLSRKGWQIKKNLPNW